MVFNPATGGGETAGRRRDTQEAVERAGLEVLWLETTREDPGQGLTAKAVAEGVDLVMAQGGDGTVMACVTGLAGTQVPLAVLPGGTGNLLATNFDVPADLDGAVEVALDGDRVRLDVAALEWSFTDIVRRHEAWRTTFRMQDESVQQVIQPPWPMALPVVDLRAVPEAGREDEALRVATEQARQPFDLERGPLLRATLVRVDDTHHRLYVALHHIIFSLRCLSTHLLLAIGMKVRIGRTLQSFPPSKRSGRLSTHSAFQPDGLRPLASAGTLPQP